MENVMAYWWEGSTSTAVLLTSASDVVGQQNKIGGNTFVVARSTSVRSQNKLRQV